MYRNFFWNKDRLNGSSNLIGWDRICKPKSFGGLGLRKAEANNVALQLKLLWKIINDNNSLWVKLVRKKYVKNDSLLAHKVLSVASWQWKNLMRLRDIFSQGLRWQIGNGADIRFWEDNWLFQYPLATIISPPLMLLQLGSMSSFCPLSVGTEPSCPSFSPLI